MATSRRILMLTRYGPLGASSRLRLLQYQPHLEAAGFDVAVSPFFGDAYVRGLGRGRPQPLRVLAAFVRRALASRKARTADLVWIEKELLPFLPAWVESLLFRTPAALVVDYDDATFHRYDQHSCWLVRWALRTKLVPLISRSRLVTVGNSYLADYAQRSGARRVEVVPTVVDATRYRVTTAPRGSEFRVGWIGSPTTTRYLEAVRAPLETLAAERPVRLVTIGAGELPEMAVPMERHPWSETTEAAVLETIDVGIMPLPDAPWERGKCGYKLVQYMACGRPVIASPVGVNVDIVTRDTGFLASNDAEWLAALRQLATDRTSSEAMGLAGRMAVERLYSLQVTAPRLVALLEKAATAS